MTEREQEQREQAAKRRAVDRGLKLTKSGRDYVLLTESDAPLAAGPLSIIEAKLDEHPLECAEPEDETGPRGIRRP